MAGDRSSKGSPANGFPPLPMKRQRKVQKYRSMTDILKSANQAVINYGNNDDKICAECGTGGINQQLILCANCKEAYHRDCFRLIGRDPPAPWICLTCSNPSPPSKSTKVEESSKGKSITAD